MQNLDVTGGIEERKKKGAFGDTLMEKALFFIVCIFLISVAVFFTKKLADCTVWLYQKVVGAKEGSLYTETGYNYDVTYTDACEFEGFGNTWTFSAPMVYNGYQFDCVEASELGDGIVFNANYNVTELTMGGRFKSDVIAYITPTSDLDINTLAKEQGVEVIRRGDKAGCVYFVNADAEDLYATDYYDCTFTDGAYCYEVKLYVEKARHNYFSQATSGVTSGILKAYGYEGSLIALMGAFSLETE